MSKINMQNEKTRMPEQDPEVRNKNFEEVALGYTPEMAQNEALRCLQCKHKPCVAGCPVQVKIPEFIAHIADGDFMGAYNKIRETNSLPAICGRVCPQETQCEQLCVRGRKGEPVGIGRLERFAADYGMANAKDSVVELAPSNGRRVGVIGSGPAGLTCAGDLAKLGYDVTVFEALHTAGGVLQYGIPEFRLPKSLVTAEIATVEALGVNISKDMVIGKVFTLDDLVEDYNFEVFFIGTGAGLPNFMGIPGENFKGVYSANEFLTRINLMHAYQPNEYDTPIVLGKRVAVVGGGNVAMDAARSAKRLGAKEVYIIYRRSNEEMPARREEIEHAEEEGIIFRNLTNPTAVLGDDDGWVSGIRCVEMELGEPDESGRRRPITKQGSDYDIELETVIIAIGNSPNPLIRNSTPGLDTNARGCIVAEEATGATSIAGVYAGGDTVTGAATVILAMGAGKDSAQAIHEYLEIKYKD